MFNSDNSVTLYQQLKDKIMQDIQMQAYKPGEKLPSERQLSKDNNISIITVRRAFSELEDMGIVERIQGKGTFVSVDKYKRNLKKYLSFTEMCKTMGAKAGAKELEKKIISVNKKVADKLEIPSDSQAVFISRLRYVNGEPMVIEKNYFALDYAYLLNEDLSNSLFDILYTKSAFVINDSRKILEIVRANKEESLLLQIPFKAPIIKIESIAYLLDNKIAYIGSQLINGERFKLIL